MIIIRILIDNKITGHFISFHCALDTKIKIWKSTKKKTKITKTSEKR